MAETEYNNKRPEVKVTSVKHSQNDDTTLEGAKYGLYTKEAIKINGKTVLEKDTLIQSSISNREGIAEFTSDIPINYTYYIREIQAPEKYYRSNEIYEFTYTYKNDETYEYIFFLMIILIKDLCPLGSLLAGIKYHSYSAVN